jgi:hypothetical protein
VLGISGKYRVAELLEVTVADNVASAKKQIDDKLDILGKTVNRLLKKPVDWRAANWRPMGETQLFYRFPSAAGQFKWICYMPTYQNNAPRGVILYEVHSAQRQKFPLPVAIPDEIRKSPKDSSKGRAIKNGTEEEWAKAFLKDHPTYKVIIKGLLVVASVALLIGSIVALLDPVPGDEVIAFTASIALMKLVME